MHLNIEDLTRAKFNILSKMFKYADVLALQETHVLEDETRRLIIPGFNMVDYKEHVKHRRTTYINQNIKEQHVNPVNGNTRSIYPREN